MNPEFSTDTPQISEEQAAKMIEAKRRLLERFRADERGQFQPTTLMTTPEERAQKRLPDGQKLTQGFPILDLGTRPNLTPENWTLRIWGEVENPVELSWDDFKALPRVRQTSDFHCVTTWSKLDVPWGGVLFADIAALAMPKDTANHVIQFGAEGYTTNTPLETAMDNDVLLADEFVLDIKGENNGWQNIPTERGGPLRMIVPKLYAWKGSKFLVGLRFVSKDEPGFWETRGYNNHADPWREERYE